MIADPFLPRSETNQFLVMTLFIDSFYGKLSFMANFQNKDELSRSKTHFLEISLPIPFLGETTRIWSILGNENFQGFSHERKTSNFN